jgi:uncharacterized protein involved in exopolysaccharide biosynthesis
MEALPGRPFQAGDPWSLDLREVFRIVWARRLRILAASAVAASITLGIAFVLPKWYRASAVILPPEENDLIRNMTFAQRALSRYPSFGVLSEYYTPADIFKAVLMSRSVQEEVEARFDLRRIYRQKSLEKTLRELKSNYRVRLNPDGTIAVNVDDRDPLRAAAMANAFLDALDRYNVEKRNSEARRTRMFLERRVLDTDSLLRVSEAILRRYQESHHTVAPTNVSAGDVQAAADLMARKIALEVRLGVLRSYMRDDNDQVIQTRSELEQLKRRIAQLPALQTDIARLTRDSKVQEQLYLLLTSELEQARIREQQDTPTVQVLDLAKPPERHVRPRRLTLALIAGVLAFLGASFWFVFRDTPRAMRQA